jgi:hypothetical protein
MGSDEGFALPTPARLQFQDYQFQVVLTSGRWKWTTRVDVSQSLPTTQVRDVITPYGLLRDTIPVPGEVVQAMADSITEVQQSYTPSILLNPTTLTFVVDEGRGVSEAKSVQITNNGLVGSLLGVTITSSAPYVFSIPASVNGLASNESGSFDVSADSLNLSSLVSPYAVLLSVQGPNATNSPQSIPVSVVVRPKATITTSVPTLTFNVASPLSGPYPPIPSQQFVLSNSAASTSVLDYQIRKVVGVPWLVSFAPVYGSLNGSAVQPITVVVAPPNNMASGSYMETLRITGYSSNMTQDVQVVLNIT